MQKKKKICLFIYQYGYSAPLQMYLDKDMQNKVLQFSYQCGSDNTAPPPRGLNLGLVFGDTVSSSVWIW